MNMELMHFFQFFVMQEQLLRYQNANRQRGI